MANHTEQWRPIPGYGGRYHASSHGRIKSTQPNRRPRILRPDQQENGYLRVTPSTDGRGQHVAVHRLVAAAFIGPLPDGHEVNHKDGDKANNSVANLEYLTRSENVHHAWRNGHANHPRFTITPDKVREIRALANRGTLFKDIAERYGISEPHVSKIVNGKRWGYIKPRKGTHGQETEERR